MLLFQLKENFTGERFLYFFLSFPALYECYSLNEIYQSNPYMMLIDWYWKKSNNLKEIPQIAIIDFDKHLFTTIIKRKCYMLSRCVIKPYVMISSSATIFTMFMMHEKKQYVSVFNLLLQRRRIVWCPLCWKVCPHFLSLIVAWC